MSCCVCEGLDAVPEKDIIAIVILFVTCRCDDVLQMELSFYVVPFMYIAGTPHVTACGILKTMDILKCAAILSETDPYE